MLRLCAVSTTSAIGRKLCNLQCCAGEGWAYAWSNSCAWEVASGMLLPPRASFAQSPASLRIWEQQSGTERLSYLDWRLAGDHLVCMRNRVERMSSGLSVRSKLTQHNVAEHMSNTLGCTTTARLAVSKLSHWAEQAYHPCTWGIKD